MIEDTQGLLSKSIFRGAIPMQRTESNVQPDWPGNSFAITCTPNPHMAIAARVCKMWSRDFKTYLAAELRVCMKTVWHGGADDALVMCSCDEYQNYGGIPDIATQMCSMYRCREYMFTQKFTRKRMHGDGLNHELLAQYAVPIMPGRVGVSNCRIDCPAVCWVPGPLCSDAQIAEFEQWRSVQSSALKWWLSNQHTALSAPNT